MPDFGLSEALEAALSAAKKTSIVPAEEGALASAASKTAPTPVAPVVPSAPEVTPPPSVRTAPVAATPPDAPTAPQVNPSRPAPDVPPQAAAQAATADVSAPPTPAATGGSAADAAPPIPGAAIEAEAPIASPQPTKGVAPGNQLPPEPTPPQISPSVQATADGFLKANIGDFAGKLDLTHMPNVGDNVMTSPEGVRAVILKVADDNALAVNAARGGVIGDDQLRGLAQDLAVNEDVTRQMLIREFGDPGKLEKVALAARMVEQSQVGTLLGLADRVASGSATNEEITRFEQQSQLVAQYRAELSGAAAVSGRTQRAFGLPVGLPPEVMDHIAGVIQRANPDMQATASAIKLAATPQGIANIVQGSFAYRSLVKAPFNMLQRVFINGILSGPPTWVKIIVGNNLNLALNTFDLYAAGIGRGMLGLASRLGGWPMADEGVKLSDAYAHMHGVISGGADGLRVVGRILKTGQSLDGILRSEEDFGGRHIATGPDAMLPELRDSYFGGLARVLGQVVDAPGTRMIGSVDAFTRTLGERGYMTMMGLKDIRARLAAGSLRPGDAEAEMVRLMQDPSDEIAQAAALWGRRMTFQSPWPEGGSGEAFQNFLAKAPALKFIFPFMRTASNIFKQSLVERTPFAVFSARMRQQIAAGGFEGDLAKARIATGTAISAMLGWMAIHDRITGDAPKDPKERMEWEADGRRPYSIRVTDPITNKESWRSYEWFEPMATLAGVTADTMKLYSYINNYENADTLVPHEQKFQEIANHIVASVIQNTGNKTFMQGAAQFAEMYNDPQRAFQMWSATVGASAQPFSGATKFLRNEQDPYLRQAFSLLDKIRDQLPTKWGVLNGSKSLPPRLDFFGDPRTTQSGNSILGPLSPFPGSPSTRDDITDEIKNVMEQTHTVPITMPSQRLALLGNGRGLQEGSGMQLTPQEYNEYITMSRHDPIFKDGTQTFKDRLGEVIDSPVYQRATPAERYDLLQSVQHEADRIGRQRLFNEDDEFRQRMMDWTAEKNRLKYGQ